MLGKLGTPSALICSKTPKKCVSTVEQVEITRFSALNSSILAMKWDCGGPRICLLWSSYLKQGYEQQHSMMPCSSSNNNSFHGYQKILHPLGRRKLGSSHYILRMTDYDRGFSCVLEGKCELLYTPQWRISGIPPIIFTTSCNSIGAGIFYNHGCFTVL